MHRRDFLLRCGLATGSLLAVPPSVGRAALSTGNGIVPAAVGVDPAALLTAADAVVLGAIGTYSPTVRLVGGGLVARYLGTVNAGNAALGLLVHIANYDALVSFLRADGLRPFGTTRAAGNRLAFRFENTDYTIDNLGSDDFNAAVLTAQNGNTALAQDALVYDPSVGLLYDPYRMLETRQIQLGTRPTSLSTGTQAVLSGLLASARYGLPLSHAFKRYQATLLATARFPTNSDAIAVANEFLKNLAALAGTVSRDQLKDLIRSPLLASALQVRLGQTPETLVTRFDAVSNMVSATATASDAPTWLAVMLTPELRTGTADATLLDPSRNDLWQATVSALPQARLLAGTL